MTSADDKFELFETSKGQEVWVVKNDPSLLLYDPALRNIATCSSDISRIDPLRGELWYRGNTIDSIYQRSFEEIAGILFNVDGGCIPQFRITHEVAEIARRIVRSSNKSTNPIYLLIRGCAEVSELLEAMNSRLEQAEMLISLFASIIIETQVWVEQDDSNTWRESESNIASQIVASCFSGDANCDTKESLLNSYLVLHADHEQNCSTTAARLVASSGGSLVDGVIAGLVAFKGDLHGGASAKVLKQSETIGASGLSVPEFVSKQLDGKELLYGFGHRVYRNWDPRARILKKLIEENHDLIGTETSKTSLELAEHVSEREYFSSRSIFPNPDLFNGALLLGLGFNQKLNCAVLSLSRTVGWIAQFSEHQDNGFPIMRPRQIECTDSISEFESLASSSSESLPSGKNEDSLTIEGAEPSPVQSIPSKEPKGE